MSQSKQFFFELINKEDNAKGQLLLKHCTERCKKNKENGLSEENYKVRTLIGGGMEQFSPWLKVS